MPTDIANRQEQLILVEAFHVVEITTNAGAWRKMHTKGDTRHIRQFSEQTLLNPDESFTWRHFQALSNELVTPKVLLCPAEKQRTAAPDFTALRNENVSYWLNPAAMFGRSDSPLAGDRNVRTTGRTEWTFIQFGAGDGVEFSADLHGYRGNVLFGDAHVDSLDSRALRLAFAQVTNAATVTLALPARDIPPEPAPEVAAAPGGGNAGAGGGGGGAAAGNNARPPAFGHNSGPPHLDGRGGAAYAAADLVVFTRLDGTFATSTVPRWFTNVATVTARPRPAEVEKSHPVVDFVQSAARKAQRQINWLLLILALLVALSLMDRMRRRLRGKRRGVGA